MSNTRDTRSWSPEETPVEAPEAAAVASEAPVTADDVPVTAEAPEAAPEAVDAIPEAPVAPVTPVTVKATAEGLEVSVPVDLGDKVSVADLTSKVRNANAHTQRVVRSLLALAGVRASGTQAVEFVPATSSVIFRQETVLTPEQITALEGAVDKAVEAAG